MPISLLFDHSHSYEGGAKGIQVPVRLQVGKQFVDVKASIDTGAEYCIFERSHADFLGISVESGRFKRFVTAAGTFGTYEHEIEMRTFDIEFSSFVYFAEEYGFRKNVLGRSGWLDRLRIGLVDYERTVFLSGY